MSHTIQCLWRAALALWAGFCGCGVGEAAGSAPSLRVDASVSTGQAPLDVTFTAVAQGFDPPSYTWSIDGDVLQDETGLSLTHTFIRGGTFAVSVAASVQGGAQVTAPPLSVEVSPAEPLVVSLTAEPQTGVPPLEVSFGSSVAGGVPPYQLAWAFGDGTTSAEESPTHTFGIGDWDVSLTVTDLAGTIASDETTIVAPPLFHVESLQYQGAFRLPAGTFGDSELNYSEGPLEYDPDHNSVFIVGHNHQQAIAEFDVPALVDSTRLDDLNMAGPPPQPFVTVLDRASGGNPQAIDRIGGMGYFVGPNGPELLVNAYEYYDAPADDTNTTLVIRNANDLSGSAVDGYFSLRGGAHTSGWTSPVPPEWQAILGGTTITGSSSGPPIISRLSVGPSAFVFEPFDIVGNQDVPNPVPTITLLDFSLDHPLHDDLANDSRTNDLWTHLSRAVYGFIPPGTRTYVTIGNTGGTASGVCYKCTQIGESSPCGGYCANDPSDYHIEYWLWDVLDLVAVREGRMAPYDVRPYDYGELSVAFGAGHAIGGGSFDPATGRLYITVQKADTRQGQYDNPPVIVVYGM